jgi:pimeloyl-ACP methyl ester carboxylesterase
MIFQYGKDSTMKKHILNLALVITGLAPIWLVSIAQDSLGQDLISPSISFVAVKPDVELEIVEWSGQGEPFVLLAGLGHTAHVFDEFAPLFNSDYRVLGITRRGFGTSSQPESSYDLTTLVNDICCVLDSLKIDQAILVGHSLAGDEMTKLASIYPDRVKALVYLDAAYDHVLSRKTLANYPVPNYASPPPTEADLASVEAYQDYYLKAEGVLMPQSEIREINIFGDDGSFEGRVTPGWIYGKIFDGLEHPQYSGIDIPTLAIYSVSYPITEIFTHHDSQDAVTKIQMQKRFEAGLELDKNGRQDFKRQMKNSKIVELEGAGHSLYITHSKEVAKIIREFLDEL